MKKNLLSVLAILLLSSGVGFSQTVKVGQNDSYTLEETQGTGEGEVADPFLSALNHIRNRQANGNTGDTIFVSGTITASKMWRMNEPADADRVYIIKGEGTENTVLQYMTDEQFDNGDVLDKSNGGLWMYCDAGSVVHMSDLTIKNYIDDDKPSAIIMAGTNGELKLNNVVMTRIDVRNTGSAGIQAMNTSSVTIDNCVFDGMIGKQGSALHAYAQAPDITMNILVTNSVFKNNIGTQKNGACQFWSNNATSTVNVEIARSVFYNNEGLEFGASSINFSSANTTVKLFNNTFVGGKMPAINFQSEVALVNMKNNLLYGSKNLDGADTVDISIQHSYDPDTNEDLGLVFNFTAANLLMENNYIESINAEFYGTSVPQSCIFNEPDDKLATTATDDQFMPAEGSVVIDAGVEIPPYTDGYKGNAPDIGAYETSFFADPPNNDPPNSIGDGKERVSDLNIYPNPANSVINIEGSSEIRNISLISVTGNILQKIDVNKSGITMDISTVTKGIYFLRVEYDSGNSSVARIVKR